MSSYLMLRDISSFWSGFLLNPGINFSRNICFLQELEGIRICMSLYGGQA